MTPTAGMASGLNLSKRSTVADGSPPHAVPNLHRIGSTDVAIITHVSEDVDA